MNYNVKYFLEQCLCSVRKAIAGMGAMEAEVFIVDNHSTDGSVAYLQPRFPWAQFIINVENLGFAKANNQALIRSIGKYILFLNPDTLLAEDCLRKTILSMESLPDAGACGVRMVDGGGRYLRESKRGFPSPWVSFCKLTGLTAIFPHSAHFARYYLGHLNELENNRVDTLSGAFMMVKKDVLEKTGGFDEQFYMYGEDIDLSYRIRQLGCSNYYLPITTVIHFKGESTSRDFRHLRFFYEAMSRFSRKYFRSGGRAFFSILLESAIWIRAGIAVLFQPFGNRTKMKSRSNDLIFLSGDQKTAEQIKPLLLLQGRTIAENREDAREIILCEGEGFSFAEIIDCIQKLPAVSRYKFHAAGSNSIIGSDSKDRRGEVIFSPNF